MKKRNLHINWGMCGDWNFTRARLKWLPTILYGNFCDLECYPSEIRHRLENLGFKVVEEEKDVFRLYDKEINTLPNYQEQSRRHK
jgi:hypothetical protein